MKEFKLKSFGVQEMNSYELKQINGGFLPVAAGGGGILLVSALSVVAPVVVPALIGLAIGGAAAGIGVGLYYCFK